MRTAGKRNTSRSPIHIYKPHSRTLEAKEQTRPTTVRHHTELLELRNTLSRNLLELRQSQRVYIPGLGPLLDDKNMDETPKLWLPSKLSKDEQLEWCLPGVPALEFCFRYAQVDTVSLKYATFTECCKDSVIKTSSTLLEPPQRRGPVARGFIEMPRTPPR